MASEYCIVHTTCSSTEESERLAASLLERNLVACIQIHCVQSRYRWEGRVCREEEWKLSMKARASDYERVQAHILEHHSYEVPEVVAVPVSDGAPGYLKWVDEVTSGATESPGLSSDA